ncbi:hypothetical protein ACFLWD_01385 [Chloroflexota bacterium]
MLTIVAMLVPASIMEKPIITPNGAHFIALALGKIEKSKGNRISSVAAVAIEKKFMTISMLSRRIYLSKISTMICPITDTISVVLSIHNH